MSDDDLWRPQEPESGHAPRPEPRPGDETQPITGGGAAPSTGQGPGGVPPPHNPYGAPPTGDQSPYGQSPYAPPPNPYPRPQEYAAPQNPYGAPYQPAYAGGLQPEHPSATTAMVLGIIGLVGIALCGGITLVLSPFAWAIGAKSVREIDGQPGRYAGRDKAQAGKVMGIIGTVLLVLGVIAVIGLIALAVSVGSDGPTPTDQNPMFRTG